MQTLIDDLLAYSRIASRSSPATPVDLNVVLAAVIDDLETRIESTGGKVELPALPTLLADPTQMRQLFQNLIGNALKFHKPGIPPLVQVEVEPAELADGASAWKFRISDQGIGFEQQYADRIFSPFQRLHGREQYAGTGIGLAIVRRIVERHGGTVEATSAPGQGAVFTLILPDRATPRALPDRDAPTPG
jgi:signal transduction histidine kinase